MKEKKNKKKKLMKRGMRDGDRISFKIRMSNLVDEKEKRRNEKIDY